MERAYKPKYLVLQEFTKILFERNPMQLPLEGNPNAEDEYESEALSILGRFNEGGLYLCVDASLQREIAVTLVKQAFQFWFNTDKIHEPEKTAFALVEAYIASYPRPNSPEHVTDPEIL